MPSYSDQYILLTNENRFHTVLVFLMLHKYGLNNNNISHTKL